jgi:Pyruvate/2-oxoacid:ferredoxin oxidoreductase delta subunit
MKELKPYQQSWLKLSTSVCEAVSMQGIQRMEKKNMSGRIPSLYATDSLAYVYGMVCTGIRAVAWINDKALIENVKILQQAVQNLQPLVLVAETSQYKLLADTGTIVLKASDAQELIDLSIVAHKLAECVLTPVMVWINFIDEEQVEAVIPDNEKLLEFLLEADNFISTPTPAQQLFFGKTRKQIPGYFHVDAAVLSGAEKSKLGMAYQNASRQMFIAGHINECIAACLKDFENTFQRRYQKFYEKQTARASQIIVTNSKRVYDLLQITKFKEKTGLLLLKQLFPLPADLKLLLKQANRIAVIEQADNQTGTLFSALSSCLADTGLQVYSALFAGNPELSGLQKFSEAFAADKSIAQPWRLDIHYTNEDSALPKRQALHQYVKRNYPQLQLIEGIESAKEISKSSLSAKRIPIVLRNYQDHGPVYSRISNFYDNAALLYETNSAEWLADPFQALPLMPPATAGFGREVQGRMKLPVLNSSACTACGDCIIHCPHAALPALALDVENFIKSGITQAQNKGENISQLIPQVKNLAKLTNKLLNQGMHKQEKKSNLAMLDILPAAFDELISQLKPEAEKAEVLKAEFSFIINEIGTFQVVVADAMYNDGSKLLFSLATDLNACTGCGICAAVCSENALSMVQENQEVYAKAEHQFSIWEKLPDTAAESIEALLAKENYNSLAAILLSRNFYMSMTGASATQMSSAKTMIHLVTALAEAALQKGIRVMVKEIEEKIERINTQLKKELSEALPDISSQQLAEGLQKYTLNKIAIDELLEISKSRLNSKLLDTAVLQRKSALIKELRQLKDLLLRGNSGVGRARYAIALDSSLKKLAEYPSNCFTVPVTLFDGKLAEMTKGIIFGHLRHIIDNIKILRRATLEENNKYNPVVHDHEIAALQWKDLSKEEKAFAPPLLICLQRSKLQYIGSGLLAQLLSEDLPVKVILLDDANPEVHSAGADIIQQVNALLPFIGLNDVQVVQSSLAQPEHLFEGLISGLAKTGSAIFQLLTPDFQQGNLQMYHAMAHNSRAFLHFDYRPDRKQLLRFSKMKIDANPSINTDWMQVQLKYGKDTKQTKDYTLTRADWAYLQADRKSYFSSWNEKMGEAIPVADYLKLEVSDRKNKVPVIFRVDVNQELIPYAVSEQIIKETQASKAAWNMLRELAGALAEFPEKVFAAAEKNAAEKYATEKHELINDYEQKIKNSEQRHLEKLQIQIKNKLMHMAGVNQ